MNSELTLEQRAARHAALAEPARLQIVDLLALGDWSPSELQNRLALPSNLLAHHLKVLESAGLIARGRSEADRRRTYVRLDATALTGVDAGHTISVRRVLFVCTANSARSQLAVALWRRSSTVPAASGGTHPARQIHPAALEAARDHGLTIGSRKPRSLDAVRETDDFVVTVCDNAHEALGVVDAVHWSIPDPVRVGDPAAFEAVFAELSRRVEALASRVVAA